MLLGFFAVNVHTWYHGLFRCILWLLLFGSASFVLEKPSRWKYREGPICVVCMLLRPPRPAATATTITSTTTSSSSIHKHRCDGQEPSAAAGRREYLS